MKHQIKSLLIKAVMVMAVLAPQVQGKDKSKTAKTPVPGHTKLPNYLQADEINTIEVIRKVSNNVVHISNMRLLRDVFSFNVTEIPAGTGTGFVWDEKGHVVTNFHVVQSASRLSVSLKDGSSLPAEVIGVEPRKDIAVLKITLPESLHLEPLQSANSSDLIVGQKTIAIGSPFGLDQSVTQGIVSATGRAVAGIGGVTIRDMIQTDASINPGNSGGPLLDSRGYLIGMNTVIYSKSGTSAGVGFAVPSNTISRVVQQIIKYGHARQPGLGVTFFNDEIVARLGLSGVLIMEVAKRGPAHRAGLRGTVRSRSGDIEMGDLIVKVGDFPVKNYDDMYNALDHYKVGDKVAVTYARGRSLHTVTITLADLQDLQ